MADPMNDVSFFNCTLVSVDSDRRETLYLDLSSQSCLVYTPTIVIFEFSVSIHVFLSLFGIYTIVVIVTSIQIYSFAWISGIVA